MGELVESLKAWGIHRPAEVVQIAAACGLDIAIAATLLEKESFGGLNIWGNDAVSTGGAYVKGSAVTREAYLRYRELEARGEAGLQGCGPGQLTSREFQLQADRLGGCWVWEINLRVAFTLLAGWQRERGIRGGFIRYNGAPAYADDPDDGAMVLLRRWITRLPAGGSVAPSPPTSPAKEHDDMTWKKEEGAPPVPDLYKEGLPPLTDPLWALANATAHAAHARDVAQRGVDDIASLRAFVASALASSRTPTPGTSAPADVDLDELARRIDLDALAAKVAGLLTDRLRTT